MNRTYMFDKIVNYSPGVEQYFREKIAKELQEMDLTDAQFISPDWYASALRTRMACVSVALKGLPNE